ncbi:hypothetical protein [Nocardioides sp. InS609-2]|uniref:hypothetical protein n=1 Tax=Nocardioides sp. InS609-2 TaxID=2760705 RepID=UPI0020C044CA|nr:hypothetical protein [Nocardioides sp. InS609-2]
MPKQLRETAAITEKAAAEAKNTGLLPIQFISAGWGSSGYYSPQVIEQAATDQVIPAGTHMYADHPTDAEDAERPVRSVKDIMAVTVGESRLATQADVTAWGADLGALVGEARVVPQWQPLLEAVRDQIGTSIRGSATDIVEGEAEGRRGGIIEGLVAPVLSVDFVTRAGRGGKVLSVMESAAANRRAIGHGIAEATVNDTREALQTVLRDEYGGDKTYVWVRDFDESSVWFEIESEDDNGVFGQTYTASTTDGVSLSGDRTEVQVKTTYVSVTRPDSNTPTATESEEDNMGKIQVEESVHTDALAKAGRVDALVSENAALKAERDKLQESDAARIRRDAGRKIIEDSEGVFDELQARGLLADLPVTESGVLDVDAFTTTVAEAAAKQKVAAGAGGITSFGQTTDTANSTTESSAPTRTAWGRTLTEQKGA